MKKNLAVILCALAMTAGLPAWAEGNAADVTDMKVLNDAVRKDKKAFVASVMQLTDAEAKSFWPLYDAYQRGVDVANRQRAVALEGLIARDRPMSDAYAKNLARDLLTADETELSARRTLQRKVMRALPPKKAARYLQLEAKIRAEQAYDIAVTFPLIK
jgi:outer membrane PBP1 activator LpoA protein